MAPWTSKFSKASHWPDPDRNTRTLLLPCVVIRSSDTTTTADRGFAERGVATFEELLEACVALGVKVMVCEMGLKALGMDPEALRSDVPVAKGGVVTFLADASRDGAMLFV